MSVSFQNSFLKIEDVRLSLLYEVTLFNLIPKTIHKI